MNRLTILATLVVALFLTACQATAGSGPGTGCDECAVAEATPMPGGNAAAAAAAAEGGARATMGTAIAETYARDPSYYGSTFCVQCGKHLPVGAQGEFVWEDGSRVGT